MFPAVRVAGMPVGGLTEQEALAVVQERADALADGFVTFSYEGRSWSPRLSEIGVAIDVAGSVQAALAYGRDDGALDRLRATGDLLRDDQGVPLSMRLDHAVLNAWFDGIDAALAGDFGLEPHDAYLVIEGTTARIEPEIDGTVVDRPTATAAIEQALGQLQPIAGPLPVVAWVPRVHAADLAASKTQVEQALAAPVRVSFEGENWTVTPEEFGRFIVQETADDPTLTGAAAVVVRVDDAALSAWLNERFGPEVNREPVDAEVGWNGERVIALGESAEGYRLRPKSFAQDLAASLFGDHGEVPIPVSVVAPAVDENNLDALGITTQIARADSNYAGSNSERATNVEVGASLLNGTLVPPGQEFAFNYAIGEITEDKGYVDAKVIAGERIDRDLGGGICQVSTTVFRAALLAGLPMTEWNPHRYRLEFYERDGWSAGFDASILQPEGDPFRPGNDFKFLNPTDSWLLVEAWTTGDRIVVIIYGPSLGYDVDIGEAVQIDTIPPDPPLEVVDERLEAGTIELTELPQEGSVWTFTREVYDADGTLIESREFKTVYYSGRYVYRVSPDMAGQSPAATGEGLPS